MIALKNAPDTLQGGYTTRELQMYRAACDRIAIEIEKLSEELERMPKPEQFRIKTGEADLNEKQEQTMGENIGNGLIKVGVSQEDLEESIAGLKGTQTYPTAAGHDWKWARHKAGP